MKSNCSAKIFTVFVLVAVLAAGLIAAEGSAAARRQIPVVRLPPMRLEMCLVLVVRVWLLCLWICLWGSLILWVL